jgi:hypothetical protein
LSMTAQKMSQAMRDSSGFCVAWGWLAAAGRLVWGMAAGSALRGMI